MATAPNPYAQYLKAFALVASGATLTPEYFKDPQDGSKPGLWCETDLRGIALGVADAKASSSTTKTPKTLADFNKAFAGTNDSGPGSGPTKA